MKTLYILRHAKSSWEDNTLADFDRPLNQRGRSAAPFMGEVMRRRDLDPEVIMASPAARARETAELAKQAGDLTGEIRFDDRIYEASPQTLSQVVSGVSDEFGCAMVVGHNPGMEGFIRLLTGKLESMPTAALAVIDLNIENWSEIAPLSGMLRTVIRPKDEIKTLETGN